MDTSIIFWNKWHNLGVPYNVQYLVVAGGGGAGGDNGGGGGAGGFRTVASKNFEVKGVTYTITVGDGGVGGTNNPSSSPTPNSDLHKEQVEEILYSQRSLQQEVAEVVRQVLMETQEAQAVAVVKTLQAEQETHHQLHHHKETMAETQPAETVEEQVAEAQEQSAVALAEAVRMANGTASSITGSSVTYAGGGGGEDQTLQATAAQAVQAEAETVEAQVLTLVRQELTVSVEAVAEVVKTAQQKAVQVVQELLIRRLTSDSNSTSGTVSTDGSDTIHSFTSSGTFTA